MNMCRKLVLFVCCLAAGYVHADASPEEVEQNIRATLQKFVPDEPVTRIRSTPFENMYEVVLGPNVIYMSGDGRYIFKGDLLDMNARENVSENERAEARKQIFAGLSQEQFIEFSPEQPRNIIYVFTDIDCGYCRRLHRDVEVLNENGLGVRYLAYPRGGIGSPAFDKMEAVWCADDRRQALTDAKNGREFTSKQCPNPVASEYELGQRFGVRGTPAIYTQDGEELSGYMPPDELLKMVNK